jgi:restriction system protein
MAKQHSQKGSCFFRYMGPVIEALQDLGGSGRPDEVVDWITERLNISEEEQSSLLASGQPRYVNDIHWERYYLAKSGYIDSSKRGVWTLTRAGLLASLSQQEMLSIREEVIRMYRERQAAKGEKREYDDTDNDEVDSEIQAAVVQTDYPSRLMEILMSLPSDGFERLSQRLLRESGFQQVNVTGRTGDGGIDGNGLLQVNPFVSFQVLFQCKRYASGVTVSQVRDFRGAMMGRADKGIIITTGTFTKDAKREAVRDGVPPIELVDGERLLDMLEQLELGLRPVTTYEVDEEFFDEFRG